MQTSQGRSSLHKSLNAPDTELAEVNLSFHLSPATQEISLSPDELLAWNNDRLNCEKRGLTPNHWSELKQNKLTEKLYSFETCESSRTGVVVVGGAGQPFQYFALTSEVIRRMEQDRNSNSDNLSIASVCDYLFKNRQDRVVDFSSVSLNKYNELYFASSGAFSPEAGLSKFFVTNRMVNTALANYLFSNHEKKDLKLKELSSGSVPTRWDIFSEVISPEFKIGHLFKSKKSPKIQVTLSDFTEEALPEKQNLPENKKLSFATEVLDLRKEFPSLPESERVGVMLTTYGFDSIWFPEDRSYEKCGNQWFRRLHGVAVLDNHPASDRLKQAFQGEIEASELLAEDFEIAVVESIAVPIDINEEPYGALVKKLFENKESARINMPVGMVNKIDQAFKTQLTEDGIFVTGDVGRYYEDSDPESCIADFATSGEGAKYRSFDIKVAELLLQELGYEVKVQHLPDFMKQYDSKGWEAKYPLSGKDFTASIEGNTYTRQDYYKGKPMCSTISFISGAGHYLMTVSKRPS